MIEVIQGQPDGTLEFKVTGKVTGEDYDEVLIPALEKALEEHDRVRLLCQIGPGFESYALDAAWDDARMGLKHWRGFERMAIVTDVTWVSSMVRALGFIMPCPVSAFPLDDLENARHWLGEPLGGIKVTNGPDNVLSVKLIGKLEASAYDGVNGQLDGFIAKHGRVRLLLDLRDFDGWQGLAGLGEHFSLVRDHRHAPERVAIVGDAEWQRLAERVFSHFINAEMEYFEASAYDEAEGWISASS
jgi:hypothetical protein